MKSLFPELVAVGATPAEFAWNATRPPGPFWLLNGWYEVSGPGVPLAIVCCYGEALSIVCQLAQPGATYDIIARGPAADSFRVAARAVAWREPEGHVVAYPAVVRREGRDGP